MYILHLFLSSLYDPNLDQMSQRWHYAIRYRLILLIKINLYNILCKLTWTPEAHFEIYHVSETVSDESDRKRQISVVWIIRELYPKKYDISVIRRKRNNEEFIWEMTVLSSTTNQMTSGTTQKIFSIIYCIKYQWQKILQLSIKIHDHFWTLPRIVFIDWSFKRIKKDDEKSFHTIMDLDFFSWNFPISFWKWIWRDLRHKFNSLIFTWYSVIRSYSVTSFE